MMVYLRNSNRSEKEFNVSTIRTNHFIILERDQLEFTYSTPRSATFLWYVLLGSLSNSEWIEEDHLVIVIVGRVS